MKLLSYQGLFAVKKYILMLKKKIIKILRKTYLYSRK